MNDLKPIFASRLKELRLEKGLSTTKIAYELGITPRAIQLYEAGKSTPHFDPLIWFAQFYNVSLDYLVGLSDIR